MPITLMPFFLYDSSNLATTGDACPHAGHHVVIKYSITPLVSLSFNTASSEVFAPFSTASFKSKEGAG